MNLRVSLKGTDEIESCCDFKILIPSPPYALLWFVLLFFTLGSNAGAQVTCPDPHNDKQLLVDIKGTLDTTDVLNWAADLDTDSWEGDFLPANFSGTTRVTKVKFVGNFLRVLGGSIPPELGCLQGLVELDFRSSSLSGSIPTELGNLSNLQQLLLFSNQLSGSIPTELGNLSNLQQLSFQSNLLTGSIPTELGNLSNLQTLNLGANFLTGSIPTELANLSNLQDLHLFYNDLIGSIPTELAKLSNLQDLSLQSNLLTGSIPTELGNLSNLQQLLLFSNQLSGSIPTELGNLSNLQELSFQSNRLSGDIPAELGNLSNLQELSLRVNSLSGSIPTELGNLSNLLYLYLQENRLSGDIPAELGNLSNLQELSLRVNSLSGPIPTELGNLSNLQQLRLSLNDLSGSIPTELGKLSNLQTLYLQDNRLSGDVPSSLGELTMLGYLWLDDNDLVMVPTELETLGERSGFLELSLWGNERLVWEMPMSNELGRRVDRAALNEFYGNTLGIDEGGWTDENEWYNGLPSSAWYGVTINSGNRVSELELSDNNLVGGLTNALEVLDNLVWLDLSENRLTGEIPTELGKLTRLQSLDLHDNELTGDIPSELGDLTRLQYLLLYDNELTGEIPSELGNLTGLTYLYLDSNKLTGEVPEFSESSRLLSVYLNDNNLSGNLPPGLPRSLTSLVVSDNPLLTGSLPLDPMVHTEVSNLDIENTDICVPGTPEFQQWLMGISFFAESGMTCGEEPPPPGQVTGVSVTPGVLQLSVSWDALADADGYKVQWKLEGSQEFDQEHTVPSGSTTTYTIPNLTAGTRYTIIVIAIVSNAVPSEEVTGIPMEEIIPPPPGQVTGVSVTPGVLQLSVSWDALADADGYKVQWKLEGSQEFDQEHTVPSGSTTTYTIPNLTAGTRYTIIVIAIVSNAVPSEEVTGIPTGILPPPPPPIIPTPQEQPEQQPGDLDRGVTGVEVTEQLRQLSVSWEEFPEASGYKIQWKSEDSQEFDEEDTVTGESTTSYIIRGLDPGTKYTVRVIAIVSNTESRPSEATGTPLGEEPRPTPSTGQQGCGACAIGSDVPGEVSQSALFNMLVVMSALLAASRRKKE